MNEDPVDKYTCLICFCLIGVPARCSKCKKIYCKDCISTLKATSVLTCPLRCKDWDVEYLPDEDLVQYNTTIITCVCCQDPVLLKNYYEHKIGIESLHLCFNFKRCKQFSIYFGVGIERPNFCSLQCYQFYWVTKNRPSEFLEDLHERFVQNPTEFECNYNHNVTEHPLEFKDKLLELDQATCAPEYSFPSPKICILLSSSRFYKTVYANKPLLKSNIYSFRVHLANQNNYVKFGVAKDNRRLENGAFCDDDFGIGFVTNGQMRHNNADGTPEVFKELNKDVQNFHLQVNLIEYELVVNLPPPGNDLEEEDENKYRAVLKIPENWETCFLAFASKNSGKICIF